MYLQDQPLRVVGRIKRSLEAKGHRPAVVLVAELWVMPIIAKADLAFGVL